MTRILKRCVPALIVAMIYALLLAPVPTGSHLSDLAATFQIDEN
jgi:hypothetical protein